jgi:hypothetical protein
MISVEHFKEVAVAHLGDDVLKDACIAILDFLINTPNEELSLITFKTIADVVGCGEGALAQVVAVRLMSTAPPALERHYLFIDDDDDEYEITDSDAADMISKNAGYDKKGRFITDAQKYLYPFFCISQDLIAIKAASYD